MKTSDILKTVSSLVVARDNYYDQIEFWLDTDRAVIDYSTIKSIEKGLMRRIV